MIHPDSGKGYVEVPAPGSAGLAVPEFAGRTCGNGSAKAALAGFGRGGWLCGLTFGQFSMIDLLGEVLGIVGDGAQVNLTSLVIGRYELMTLGRWVESGKVSSVRLLISRLENKGRLELADIARALGDDNVRLTRTHAKVATVTGCGWHIAITASMNLTKNLNVEQFEIADHAGRHDFFVSYFDAVWDTLPPISAGARVLLPKAALAGDMMAAYRDDKATTVRMGKVKVGK